MRWTIFIGLGSELQHKLRWDEPVIVTPPIGHADGVALQAAEAAMEYCERFSGAEERLSILDGPSFKVGFTARVVVYRGPNLDPIDVVMPGPEKSFDNIGLATKVAQDAARQARAIVLRNSPEPLRRGLSVG